MTRDSKGRFTLTHRQRELVAQAAIAASGRDKLVDAVRLYLEWVDTVKGPEGPITKRLRAALAEVGRQEQGENL
jgi:hypothetical protein